MLYKSYDKKSHYPATMTMRYFPFDFQVIEDNKTETLKKLFAENLLRIGADNYETFKSCMMDCSNRKGDGFMFRNYLAPSFHAFIAEVELKNVRFKTYGLNCMPLIAVSKTNLKPNDFLKNSKIIVDNGKLLQSDNVTVRCTDLDFLAYHLMYEFEIHACKYLEVSDKFKFADSYIQSTIRYHLVNKNEISLLIKGKKTIDELTDFSGHRIFSDDAIDSYNQMSESEQKDFIDFYYMMTKSGGLNNQYGINVQKIVNDNIFFNLSDYRYQKDVDQIQGCYGVQTSRDYITGLYITAYARLDLAFMTYMIYRECDETDVVYWDTDSIKLRIPDNELDKVTSLFEWYNERINVIRDFCIRCHGELYNLGIWENDGNYKFFYTLGAKKYVVCEAESDEIVVTNAGINKKIFSAFLNEKYHTFKSEGLTDYEAFQKMLCEFYHPNVNLGADVTGRKIISYPYLRDEKIKKKMIDENGDELSVNQYPCALITECDYMLSATAGINLINKQHYQLCRRLQLNEGITFNCNIKYNEVGKIVSKVSDDFTDYIIDI